METIDIGPFLGIDNRRPDFALRIKDQGDYVRDAVNVDLDNTGHFHRRAGYTLVQALTSAHSKFEASGRHYLVRDSVLYRVGLDPYGETLVKLLMTNAPVSYVEHNGDVYFSNGTDSGRVAADDTVYPWGMATPAQPSVANIAGTIPAGKYQVGVTYFNAVTGEEGGCAGTTNPELTVAGAFRVTLPGASPGATHVRVYVTQTNGEEPGLYATVAVGTASLDITSLTTTQTLKTAYLEPLPAGTRLFVHMGRLCSVKGNVVHYSQPFNLGYYLPSDGYIPFETDVSVAVPAQFGVYIAADKTRWFAGSLHAPDQIVDVLPYGAVPGTEFALPHTSKVGWFGAKGVVLADPQGQADAVMADHIDQTPPARGCSAVFGDADHWRVVSCGWCVNVQTGAATRYDNYAFTSMSGTYGTLADGLYLLAGTTDSGDLIEGSVSLGKQNFGTENLKYLPAAYVGVSSPAEMQLEVKWVDDSGAFQDYVYLTRGCSEVLQVQRVDTGRGMKATWFDLTIYNSDGAEFTLASVSFAPSASVRRI